MTWILLLSLLLLTVLLLASRRFVWWKVSLMSVLLLALSAWWLINKLSGDGLNAATLYHLGADMEGAGVADFKGYIAGFIALALVSLVLPALLVRRRRWAPSRHGGAVFAGFAAMWLVAIAVSPLYRDGHRLYQQTRPVDYSAIAPEYQVPQQPLRKPRNIVWIYGESLERTYLDETAFPGLMPNLNRLAAQSLDVRGLTQAEGGGWTIAGLVSSMCGVPLTTAQGDENSMGRMGSFLPERLPQAAGLHQPLPGWRQRVVRRQGPVPGHAWFRRSARPGLVQAAEDQSLAFLHLGRARRRAAGQGL